MRNFLQHVHEFVQNFCNYGRHFGVLPFVFIDIVGSIVIFSFLARSGSPFLTFCLFLGFDAPPKGRGGATKRSESSMAACLNCQNCIPQA